MRLTFCNHYSPAQSHLCWFKCSLNGKNISICICTHTSRMDYFDYYYYYITCMTPVMGGPGPDGARSLNNLTSFFSLSAPGRGQTLPPHLCKMQPMSQYVHRRWRNVSARSVWVTHGEGTGPECIYSDSDCLLPSQDRQFGTRTAETAAEPRTVTG